jgi:prolyl oligopeptidase
MPASIPAAEQGRLQKAATEAYTQGFQPAWQKYRNYVADAYLPKARASISMSELPNGKELYALLVRNRTTTNMTPEQIHEIGKREVERIQASMAAIRKELGFTGTAEEFNAKVLMAPEFVFKTEADIVTHGRDIAKRIDPELPRLFKVLPRMPYGVRAIPADRARTAAPYYEGPAMDGSRAGNFYLRTADPQTQSRCCMQALIMHEAVPGHHLQIALATEMTGVPEFRRSGGHTAYIEGWGLYAESLGTELGLYETPYERYGQLQSEILRALRLVTDTGLHHYGWTRDQAVATMGSAKGGWITDDVVASEVDRYIAIPGQALAYKVGELKIKELRARAEKALGAKFDIRDFHDVVLRNGSIPLTVLEREVDRWIANTGTGLQH